MRLLPALFLLLLSPAAPAGEEGAGTALALLDYIAADYPEAIAGGEVVNADEYAEMQEFGARVAGLLEALPERDGRATALARGAELTAAIDARAAPARIVSVVSDLRAAILSTYRPAVAPREIAPRERVAGLYAAHCAACHGATGAGDGPAAAALTPPATDFTDPARAGRRSVYGYFSTLTAGVEGTAMASYARLDDAERWGLAFYVASFSDDAALRERGAVLLASGTNPGPTDLQALVTSTGAGLASEDARAAYAWLKAHPEALLPAAESPLEKSARLVSASLDAYRGGRAAEAARLALSAYLDGFEMAEAPLSAVDAELVHATERAMMNYRALIEARADGDAVAGQAAVVQDHLALARDRLADDHGSWLATLIGSFLILFREGLEAMLVVAGLLTILVRTARRQALKYVHGGWIAALVAGVATWLAARSILEISGAGRELTEGVAALAAASILLYVGIWLHGKSHAQRWNAWLAGMVNRAIEGRTLLALSAVSFLAVYREAFETILFYEALWPRGGRGSAVPLLAGMGTAAAALLLIGWLMFRASARLPLQRLFAASSILLAALAVIFAGSGIAALQEAGVLPLSQLELPAVPALGIYPTLQGIGAQLLVLTVVLVGFRWSTR